MDAVDFLKAVNRMCSTVNDCSDCDIENLTGTCHPKKGREEELVSTVEKWAKQNPIKTRLSEFLKKYPNAPIERDGIPGFCATFLGYKEPPECALQDFCVQCWNIPIE